MKSTAKIIIVLTLITIISGAILAVLDSFTAPKIEAYQNNLKNDAVAQVLPQGVKIEEITKDGTTIFKATKKGQEAGYAFQVSGGGYQSELVIMVGVTPDFSQIIGTKMIAQVETPGLGTKIENDPSNKENAAWFMTQFEGVSLNPQITYVKNAKPSKSNEIQAITGATISSAAVVDILNNGVKEAKALLNK
jgi:electron transport complex protein RnfG